MTRLLPPQPSFEFLQKQAKQRLVELRRADPAAKLVDAQHALAREYGFASWPKLKTHVLALAASAPAKPVASPLAGRWTANVSQSQRHPANQFRAATLQVKVSGDRVIVFDRVVDETGRETLSTNSLEADGQEHLAEQRGGYSIVARWRDERTLDVVVSKNGQVEGRVTYQVSRDDQTLIIITAEQRIVMERVAV